MLADVTTTSEYNLITQGFIKKKFVLGFVMNMSLIFNKDMSALYNKHMSVLCNEYMSDLGK